MLNLIDSTCLIGAIASVGIPLVYAVGTLNGLQHKTVYPLFRFIDRNGSLESLSSTEAPSS